MAFDSDEQNEPGDVLLRRGTPERWEGSFFLPPCPRDCQRQYSIKANNRTILSFYLLSRKKKRYPD
jgi:hypothetical protein